MDDTDIFGEDGLVVEDRQETTGTDSPQLPTTSTQDGQAVNTDSNYGETGVTETVAQAQVFTSQPTPPYGYSDTWQDGADIYTCVQPRTASESYSATDWQLIVNEEVPDTTTKTTTTYTVLPISDFSAEELAALEESGADVYEVYDDGTVSQAGWEDVVDLTPAAETATNEAHDIASATNQHFWHRSTDDAQDGAGTGAFLTDMEKDDFLKAAAGGFSDASDNKPYHNMLLNSLGMLLRTAKNNLVSLSRSATTFYDGLGNAASNVVAYFGRDGSRIGRTGESRAELDYHSFRLVDKDDNAYFEVEDSRETDGTAQITETFKGGRTTYSLEYAAVGTGYTVTVSDGSGTLDEKSTTSFEFSVAPNSSATVTVVYNTASQLLKFLTFGLHRSNTVRGSISTVMGYLCEASGNVSQAFGILTKASGECSHAEGVSTEAIGGRSHTEGTGTIASGENTHAEGAYTEARYATSHAEGTATRAYAVNSHVEGLNTYTSGDASHAEGRDTIAGGDYAHAQNQGTRAAYEAQTAMGKYNANDSANALEVGNGTDNSNRSNAFEVTWTGKLKLGSDVPSTEITLSNACQKYDSNVGNTPRYRKVNGTVYIAGAVKPKSQVAAGGSLTICTLPEGCRPENNISVVCRGSGFNRWYLLIAPNGTCTASAYGVSSNADMPTTAFLIFSASFPAA